MTSFDVTLYLLNVAPALGLSVIVLYYLWKQYNEQILYQREQDKNNLETLMDLSKVLRAFEKNSRDDNVVIKKSIVDEASKVREHIDKKIVELRR